MLSKGSQLCYLTVNKDTKTLACYFNSERSSLAFSRAKPLYKMAHLQSNFIKTYTPSRNLHSMNIKLLVKSKTNSKKYSERGFEFVVAQI